MVGYGALINSDLMNQLNNALNSMVNTLKEVPFYWYIAALIGMFVLFKLLITTKIPLKQRIPSVDLNSAIATYARRPTQPTYSL